MWYCLQEELLSRGYEFHSMRGLSFEGYHLTYRLSKSYT